MEARELRPPLDRQGRHIVDVMAGAERGALLVRERFERDGRTAEVERLLVYAVRDGLLSECWVYDQDQTLVDAFLT